MMGYLQQMQMQQAEAAARNQVPWYMRPPGMDNRPEPVQNAQPLMSIDEFSRSGLMGATTQEYRKPVEFEGSMRDPELVRRYDQYRSGKLQPQMNNMPRPPMGGYGGMMGMGLGQMFGMGGGYGRPQMPPQYGGGFGGGFPGMMGYGRPPMPPQMNPFGFGGGYGRPPMPQYGGFGMGFGGGFGGYQPQPQQFGGYGGYGGMRTQPAQPQYQSQMQPPQQSPFGNPIAQRMGQAQQSSFGSPMRMY